MLDTVEARFYHRKIAHHSVGFIQGQAVIVVPGGGLNCAVGITLRDHVDALGADETVVITVGRYAFAGITADGACRHRPAEAEGPVALGAAITQAQGRREATARRNGQGHLQARLTPCAHGAPLRAGALDGATALGQRRNLRFQEFGRLHAHR